MPLRMKMPEGALRPAATSKACSKCGQVKALSDYYANRGCADGRYPHCKDCHKLQVASTRSARAKADRAYFQEVKVSRGCFDCGYQGPAVCFDFDHVPERGPKFYKLAQMAGMRRELIDAEIAKCDVLCANCHRLRTAMRLAEAGWEEAEIAAKLAE